MTPDRPGYWWYRDRPGPPEIAKVEWSDAWCSVYWIGTEIFSTLEECGSTEWLGPVVPFAPAPGEAAR